MKRIIISLVTLLFLAGAAYATPITFTDTTRFTTTGTLSVEDLQSFGGPQVNVLTGFGDYVTWKHFFTFSPPAGEILEGTLRLKLVDDERDTLNPSSWEFAFGFAEDGQWDVGAVNSGTYQYNVNVGALMDGAFEVTLLSLAGDFSIRQSDLTITYEPVPEPSTILLLSAGLLGVGYFARKRNA